MKVLVTGSKGFIGWHLTSELEQRGHTVVPYDHPHDVRDTNRVAMAVRQAEVVINLAGVLGTEETLRTQVHAAEVNIVGAINVMDACARFGRPLVQIGTGHKGQLNPYAITKACAEDLAVSRAQWLGEVITIVRAFHAYGPRQLPPPPWGDGHAAKILPVFACCALEGKPLPLNGGGRQVVDMVHVSSVARVLADAAENPRPGLVLEAGTGIPRTVAMIAHDISRATGHGDLTVDAPARMGEPVDAHVVALAPAVPMTECWPYKLTETLAWYREHYGR